jgi:ribosomal protein S16
VLKNDRVSYWMSQGAIPSDTVKQLMKKAGNAGEEAVAS